MRWRVLALVSLGVNLLLAIAWVISLNSARNSSPNQGSELESTAATAVKTNLIIRRLPFSWREVESTDYPTYIANLRDIGCPPQTIRDIIIADINAMYARKMATEIVTSEQQWWRAEPDTNIVQAAAAKSKALDDERRALLASLLGNNWESGDLINLPRPTRQGLLLDGPLLGNLPTETKHAVEEVSLRTQDRIAAYLDEQRRQGKNPDASELARLRQESRTELQGILSPTQLEEFLLRYSQNAESWRTELGQLRYFEASPDEFRAMFRATDTLDEQIQLLSTTTDPNLVTQRRSLEAQREEALKIALGPERYEQYRLLHDPLYRDAIAAAQQAGAPETAQVLYEINLAAAEEQNRIRASTNLTTEQKNIELKRLELEALQANTAVTGKELPPEPPPPPSATQTPRKIFVLGPGDSAATISLLYGVPLSALRAANPNIDVNRLKPGDSINIPPNAYTPGAAVR